MQLAFIRHGERQRGDRDPALTSAGRRMAMEAGEWLRDQGFSPTRIVTTRTARTRQTAAQMGQVFPDAQIRERDDEPQTLDDWLVLTEHLRNHAAPVVLVGHHPTLAFLLRAFGPPPRPVPLHHFAATVRLVGDTPDRLQMTSVWPGRPAS